MFKLGRYDDAITNYDIVLDINPINVESLNNKDASLHRLGRYDDAIHNYNIALAIDANHQSPSFYKRLFHNTT